MSDLESIREPDGGPTYIPGPEWAIVTFLLAQIAADEAIAQRANGLSGWHLIDPDESDEATIGTDNHNMILYGEGGHTWEDAEHIITWDPARVLAECAAKRKILEIVTGDYQDAALDAVLYELAQPYADRPGFDPDWKATT